MFYVNMQADSTGINMVIHYNALKNADTEKGDNNRIEVADALLIISNVCSATDRPIDSLKDIYLPPDQISGTMDGKGVANTGRIVKHQIFSRESGISSVMSPDLKHMPGRISIGDISSDGFPDIMMTMKYDNGTDQTHILLNTPCQKSVCSEPAKKMHRRMFNVASNSYTKFLADDEDFDDTLYNSIFEGHLNRLNFTDSGDDFAFMGEEFA